MPRIQDASNPGNRNEYIKLRRYNDERMRTYNPVFSFVQLIGLNILSPFDVEIPVPEGEEETACKIAFLLRGGANQEENAML